MTVRFSESCFNDLQMSAIEANSTPTAPPPMFLFSKVTFWSVSRVPWDLKSEQFPFLRVPARFSSVALCEIF